MYKAIVFDFDGTIVDTEQHLFNIINKHLISHNATPITLDFYRENIGGEAKDLHEYLEQTIGNDNKETIYKEHHQTSNQLEINPTIKQLMKYLKQRHIPMAIATSSYKKDIFPVFKSLGLDEYINIIVGRESVEYVKPEPELYLTAVQQLNYSPTHCLAIEDSVNGAKAAFRAGLDVIVNTNYMTQTQDFSTIPYIGKDLNNEEIINRFFEKGHV